MRIMIQQTTFVIEFDDQQEQPVCQPKTRPLSLLEKLWKEVETGRNAKLWPTDQHAAGPQSPSGPLDGRPRNPTLPYREIDG